MEPKPVVGLRRFGRPAHEQLGDVDVFFSNHCSLQSVYFEYISVRLSA